jgi:putative phosphoribosyl transferase
MFFENREEALKKLLEVIDKEVVMNCVVLTIGKRGVFYAREIALKNGLLEGDFLFIEEIKSPVNKNTVVGALSETRDYVLIDELIESFGITEDYLYSEMERVYEEKILRNIRNLRAGEGIISLKNKNVLLVDEGANTGLKLLCAIKSCLGKEVNSVNVAMPIIAKDTAEIVEKIVDNAFFVKKIDEYVNTDFYFKEYNNEL